MSDAPTSTPNPNAARTEAQRDFYPLKLLGIEIPLPHWALSALAVVAIVAVPVIIFITLKHMQSDDAITKQLNETKAELKSEQDLVRSAHDDYAEYNKHAQDKTNVELRHDPDLTVRYYASDKCLYVERVSASGVTPQWLRAPALNAPQTPAPGPTDGGIRGELQVPNDSAPYQPAALIHPPDDPAGSVQTFTEVQARPCGGKCVNPHPGNFKSSNGTKQGCWVQVWRKWPDGCTHYQWFNSCTSLWDADPKGKPRVYWTCCTH
jgi:hypothetical protein